MFYQPFKKKISFLLTELLRFNKNVFFSFVLFELVNVVNITSDVLIK